MISLEEFSKLKEELFELKNTNFDLNAKNNTLKKEIEKLNSEIENSNFLGIKTSNLFRLKKLTDLNNNSSNVNDNEKFEKKVAKSDSNLNNKIQQLKEELNKANKTIETLQDTQSCRKTPDSSKEVDLDDKKDGRGLEDAQVENQAANINNENDDNNKWREEIKKRDEILSLKTTQHEDEIKKMTEKISNLEEENKKLMLDKEIKKELEDLKALNESLKKEKEKGYSEINLIQQEYEKLKSSNCLLLSKYEALERDLKKCKDEYDNKIQEYESKLREEANIYEKVLFKIKKNEEEYKMNTNCLINEIGMLSEDFFKNLFYFQNYIKQASCELNAQKENYNLLENRYSVLKCKNEKEIKELKRRVMQSSKFNRSIASETTSMDQESVKENIQSISLLKLDSNSSVSNIPVIDDEITELVKKFVALQQEKWKLEERIGILEKSLNFAVLEQQKNRHILSTCFSYISPSILISNFEEKKVSQLLKNKPLNQENAMKIFLDEFQELIRENSMLKIIKNQT